MTGDAKKALKYSAQQPRMRSYWRGLIQQAHTHDQPHLSLILAGSLTEVSGGHELRIGPGMFAVRPTEFSHQVGFGPTGALIVSMGLSAEDFAGLASRDIGRWAVASNGVIRNVLEAAVQGGSETSFEDSVWDALAASDDPKMVVTPAPWLLRARDRLIEESASIGELSAEAGVHRVYFSRAFTRAFGLAPTLYRRRQRGLRAAAAALKGEPAADTAFDCGFADQSHMARVVGAMTGNSFGQLRRLWPVVTSVQD